MATEVSNGCPYKGLQPYTEEDQDYFFGRERDGETIASNLFAAPLTILYGNSGVGKSSVLQAGAIPQLRQNPKLVVTLFGRWQGEGFDLALKAEVLKAVCENTHLSEEDVLKEVARVLEMKTVPTLDRLAFDDLLTACSRAFRRRILIIFDQFEEYFLYHAPTTKAEGFDAEFARAVNQHDSGVNFMLAMREEELSKLDRFRPRIPTLLSNLLRLDHLDRTEATNAIRKPLAVYNTKHAEQMFIEDPLVDEIINQVRPRPFAESDDGQPVTSSGAQHVQYESKIETPFLQLVLVRLWNEERAHGSTSLRLSTFQGLGGAKAIARAHLDKVMEQLSDSEREVAASVLRFLVTPKGSKIALDPATLAGFANQRENQVRDVLTLLSAGKEMRILRKVTVPGQSGRYELFHDVLGPAILEWRARYVQEQQLVQERAQVAERFLLERQRRLRIALSVLIFLLLMLAGVTVFAVKQWRRASGALAEAVNQTERAKKSELDAKGSEERAVRARLEAEAAKRRADIQAGVATASLLKAQKSEGEALEAKKEAVRAQHSAESQSQLAKSRAKQIEEQAKIINLDLQGFDETRAGNMEDAINYFGAALDLSKSQNNASGESYALLNIAESYATKSGTLSSDAIRVFFDATLGEIEESEIDKTVLKSLYLGGEDSTNLQETNKNREDAVKYFKDAIKANDRQSVPDLKRRGSIHQRIGDVYFTKALRTTAFVKEDEEKTLTKIIEFYDKASDDYRAAGLRNEEGSLQARVGMFLTETKPGQSQQSEAIAAFDRARQAFGYAKERSPRPFDRTELAGREALMQVKIGDVYSKEGHGAEDTRKAIPYYEQAASMYEKLGKSQKAADNYSDLGNLYVRLGEKDKGFDNFVKARKAFRAAEIAEQDDGKKAALVKRETEMLTNIGSLYDKSDPQSLPKLQAYYDSVANEYGDNLATKASVLHSIGETLSKLNDQSASIIYYEREAQVWQQAGKRKEEGNAFLRIGEVYNSLHDYANRQKILSSFSQARTAYLELDPDALKSSVTEVVSNLITIAKYYGELGEKKLALDSYSDVLVLSQKRSANETVTGNFRVNEVIQAGAKIITELRRDEQEAAADRFFNNALSYYQVAKDNYNEGSALEIVAQSYGDLGNSLKAISYYQKAHKSYQKTNYYYQFDVLRKIARLYFARNDQKGAADYFRDVVESYRPTNTAGEASALAAIAASYSEAGDKATAIIYYEQAYQIRARSGDRNAQIAALRTLIAIYREVNQTARADELAKVLDQLEKPSPKR